MNYFIRLSNSARLLNSKTELSLLHASRSLVTFKSIFGKKEEKSKEVDFTNAPVQKEELITKEFENSPKEIRLLRKKAYKPVGNVENEIKNLAREVLGASFVEKNFHEIQLSDPANKFNLLTKCITKFQHDISNTTLNDIKTIGDLVDYYLTEQRDTSTLEELKQMPSLPPNLHINLEYNRFDPETDNLFEGRDAFPKRDTVVTSLWYSKKYKSVTKKSDYFSK